MKVAGSRWSFRQSCRSLRLATRCRTCRRARTSRSCRPIALMHDAGFDAEFDAGAIRSSTRIRHVEIHDSLASTNDRATQLAADGGVELPALIVAREQTAGRGRG